MDTELICQKASILWQRSSSTSLFPQSSAQSPLLYNPPVLPLVLKYLNFWDIQTLFGVGNIALKNRLQRECMEIAVFNEIGGQDRLNQPFLRSDPFNLISQLLHITSVTIISPYWVIPTYSTSPLASLPSTLLHLTVWSKSSPFENIANFINVPFGEHFSRLETLRLCFSVSERIETDLPKLQLKLESLPKSLRVLSLVGSSMMTAHEATKICPTDLWEESHKSTTDHFTSLRLFEWGGNFHQSSFGSMEDHLYDETNFGRDDIFPDALMEVEDIGITPSATTVLPTLLHYYCHTITELVYPLPPNCYSSSMEQLGHDHTSNTADKSTLVKLDSTITKSPSCLLQTYHLDFHTFGDRNISEIPSSITHLHLGTEAHGETPIHCDDLSVFFPHLRSLHVDSDLATDSVKLPITLTSLSYMVQTSTEHIPFKTIPPPPALTQLNLVIWEGTAIPRDLSYLPSTLTDMHFRLYVTTFDETRKLIRALPPQLRSFTLSCRVFEFPILELLPRGLEKLEISSSSLRVFVPEPLQMDFDFSGLPPHLTSLTMRSSTLQRDITSSALKTLPNSLKYLLLWGVELPPPADDHNGYSSSEIAAILENLPSDCWCNILFYSRSPEKTYHLRSSILRQLPNGKPVTSGKRFIL